MAASGWLGPTVPAVPAPQEDSCFNNVDYRAARRIGSMGGEWPTRMMPNASNPNLWYNAVLAGLLDSR